MSNNDYFTIAYKILSYLKYCYENGQDTDPNILKADTFDYIAATIHSHATDAK
ncbi:hypothetical protein [Lactobacillus sp. ESL0233]|uniref:hypothetical protein n=1 Tax=Lactobacillus sp. ESL0233 TaxID=2069354 RepID=UPI001314001B|nr:hypothetical protein [Lactobacillus sp. ESL0233]